MRYLILFVATALLGFGACGSSDDSTSDTTSVTTNDTVTPTNDVTNTNDATASTDGTTSTVEACPTLEAGDPTQLASHRIQRASSTDGLTFTPDNNVLLSAASVPDAVYGPDGKIWVYFVNGNRGQHAVFIARMSPADTKLETFDCIRINGKIEPNAVDPDIVKLADGRYRLFYFKGWFMPGNGTPQTSHPMYSAISDDGIHFTIEQKLIEVDNATDPTAVQLGDGSWLMAMAGPQQVFLASSSDGKSFSLTTKEFGSGIPELHRFKDGTIRLYVTGLSGLIIYKSSDGKEWVEEKKTTLPGADPSMLLNPDGTYYMYYKSFDAPKPKP